MSNILKGKWVFDTNILVYGLDKSSVFFDKTYQLFVGVKEKKIEAVIAQQSLVESLQVFVKGYKQPPQLITRSLNGLITELGIKVIAPLTYTYQRFFTLVGRAQGKIDIFDYYLAATMLDNGISQILTVNTKDFRNIKEIEAINPFKS